MNKRKLIFGTVVFISTPIMINYLLLSWRAPGVNGEVGDWLGFYANFLGVIGAVVIALTQYKKQREHDEKQDIENNRSYVDVQDFRAPMMLVGVKTHENSRIISTEGYEHLKKEISPPKYKGARIPYLKISHYGTAPVITNCNLKIDLTFQQDGVRKTEKADYFLGSIEQGIEVFMPLVPIGTDEKSDIDMMCVIFDYVTLKGEHLTLYRDYVLKTETLYGEKNEIIYNSELKAANWIYPNKIDHSKQST